MGILNSYFPIEKVRNFLSRNELYGFQYLMSLFGVCNTVLFLFLSPAIYRFCEWWHSIGCNLCLLVTSPLVNEVAIGLFLGLLV